MDIEYRVLNTLVENGGSMSLAALMNALKVKQGTYSRQIMRALEKNGLLDEASQCVTMTKAGYLRHAELKQKLTSDAAYRTGEWIRWAVTTLIAILALWRTFL